MTLSINTLGGTQGDTQDNGFTFIYRDPYEIETKCNAPTYDEAKYKAQELFYEDFKHQRWTGMDTEHAIYPMPGSAAEQVYNTAMGISEPVDEPEANKTYALMTGSDTPSISNGNTWAESEVVDEPVKRKLVGTIHEDKRTVSPCEVSEVAVKRQAEHDLLVTELGIARSPENIKITKAGYIRGKAVLDSGYANLNTAREVWDNKPTPNAAIETFMSTIHNEDREDWKVNMSDIRMEDDGSLHIPNVGNLNVESVGLSKLLSVAKYFDEDAYDKAYARIASQQYRTPVPYPERSDYTTKLYPRALSMFLRLDPDVRAYVFNEHMKRHGYKDQEVKLRTRVGPDGRGVFSAVSPTYTTYDSDDVAAFIGGALDRNYPEGMFKGEIEYNAQTTDFAFNITMHAPSDLQDFSAGDLFEVGYRFKSNDVGGGSIKGGPIAFWNECLNMIIISSKVAEMIKVVHKGDVASKLKHLYTGMAKGREAMQRFAVQWGILNNMPVDGLLVNGERIESFVNDDGIVERAPIVMLKTLVDTGRIGKGIGRDAAVEYLLESYNNQGGGESMHDIVNAITRMAHESMVDDCVRDGLERQAGELVPILAKAANSNSLRL